MKTAGTVFLVGAGPGDPKLLTIKAAEAIAASDVIVFDSLVNPEVLVHAKRGAQLIFAGKRAGEREMSQKEINSLLIDLASGGQTVARVKGGDPFIFGRGGEEAEALAAAGIEYGVIPGISSGVAAPAYAGIPVTHRDHASSVIFVTGHDTPDKSRGQVDWSAIGRAADTIVVFMCGRTIQTIARELVSSGRSGATPIAIIRWGTYEEQELYAGTLDDLAERGDSDEELRFESPAIGIIGEVVALRERLDWFQKKELSYALSQKGELARV
ncbi:MAG TPA: uroporphyrinogen-III C-methyltransferase [Blastocatellia bacterium]|nr:uroporphyrinogen-III C-methyltransferase [Blastocatellia bacterium]